MRQAYSYMKGQQEKGKCLCRHLSSDNITEEYLCKELW
jgi:hypothetical protein